MTINSIAKAIARMEGFGKKNSAATRNNNPGNLRYWGPPYPLRTFQTEAEGWAALERQIGLNVKRGLTLEEFFAGKPGVYAGYAPVKDTTVPPKYANRPREYAEFVSGETGIPLGVPLDKVVST